MIAAARGLTLLLLAIALGSWGAPVGAGALVFSAQELATIASFGPWPMPRARDPGNALSGRPEAVALGRRLFFDPGLSPAGVACAHCHRPDQAFADGRARSRGVAELDRNAPSLLNAVHERWLGWDGAADSLWSQSIRPLLDAREMASSPAWMRRRIAQDAALARQWRRVFGRAPKDEDAQTLLVGAAKALGAYVATLASPRTPFDDFRDAVQRADTAAAARYPLAAQRGLRLFIGRGNCHLCHGGPMFSHGEFADIGARFFVRPGVVDTGRHGGIEALRTSPYRLDGRFADPAPDGADEAVKTRHLQSAHRNFGEFKVPSLRHVALTAPYLHDGSRPSLRAVLQHYSSVDPERLHSDGERLVRPLHLSQDEEDDLLAFLNTLTPRR